MRETLARAAVVCALWAISWTGPARALDQIPPGATRDTLTIVSAGGMGQRTQAALSMEGSTLVPGEILAQVLGGTFSWVSELGAFRLHWSGHDVEVVDQSAFCRVDRDEILPLGAPAFLWEGRMWVPLDVVVDRAGLPRPWVELPLRFDRRAGLLQAGQAEQASLIEVHVIQDALGWKLSLVADHPFTAQLMRAERASMVLRLKDVAYDPMTVLTPKDHPWFQGLRFRDTPRGVEVAFSAGVLPRGYRVIESHDKRTVEILLGVDERDIRTGHLVPFAAPSGAGDMRLNRLVLDPGHDAGSPGGEEAYAVCRMVQDVLSGTLGMDVLLTHPPDRDPAPEVRVGRANEAGGDLLISLHIHSRPKGPTVYVSQPALPVPVDRDLTRLGFRPYYAGQEGGVQIGRAVAQDLLQAVADALEESPGGVFTESLPELQGALMPAVLLEIGLGEAPWDDDRRRRVVDAVCRAVRKQYWRTGP